MLIEAARLSKSFPGVRALDRVDFSVRSGEVHALVGENGAGKSTLIRVLSGEIGDYDGQLTIDGHPARWGLVDRRAAASRVVDGGGLEDHCTRKGTGGVESLSLRQLSLRFT